MKGRFRPKNPPKYKGNPTNIIYRSSWELKLFRYLDIHPDIVWWQSEELTVPYRSPITGRVHRYFPDVILKKKSGSVVMIEVKPKYQTVPPDKNKMRTPTGKIKKSYINEVKEWGKNQAKWEAAQEYCIDRGWNFQIMTEQELGIK
tara:strand:- start:12177 stop:12614 length:438 start_codon:yes stop_codon:yes gene_type:complete